MTYSACEFQLVRDGLYLTLTSCGPFGRTEVSACDYGVIESTAGSAIMIMPGATKIDPQTYGNVFMRAWGVTGEGWIKDTGDSIGTLSRVWAFHDDLFITIVKDQSLNGVAQAAYLTGFNYNPYQARELGSISFAVVTFQIVAECF